MQIWKQESQPDPQDPTGQVKGITKASVKIGHVVTLIRQLANFSDRIQEVIDIVRRLRENVESLDALFLQQGNLRRVIREEKFRVRIGALHE